MTEDTRFDRVARVIFWLLLISYVGFLLSLGSFPSEDGPVHLYYADVLRELLTGGHSYGQYFEVRHWLPPYALVYYLVMGLDRLASPLVADRLVVCLYTVLIVCGFRYLLRVLNPRSTAMAVLVFPFVFNKFVYLGFYNFVLAVAVAVILCAYWLCDPLRLRGGRRSWFLVLVVMVLLTHPVPLLVAFLLMGTHLLVAVITEAAKLSGPWSKRLLPAVRQFRTAIASLLAACVVSLYVLPFVSGAGRAKFPDWTEMIVKVRKLILFGPISPFQVWYYALPPGLLVFGVSLLVTILAFRRRITWSHSQLVVLGVGVLCLLLYIVVPDVFSGGAYFDQRFPIFGVLFILAAFGSNAAFERGHYRGAIVVLTIVVSVGSLTYQIKVCRQYQLAVDLYRLPAVRPGTKGAIVMDEPSFAVPPGFAFGPYRWVGAHYFRHSKAVLLNSPFLYTGTMPVRIAPSSLTPLNPVSSEINALTMERILVSYSPTSEVDFVVFIGDSDHLPADSLFGRMCSRFGFVKAWGTDTVSIFMRPVGAAR